jgi:ATP-dependent DNA helicase DinG
MICDTRLADKPYGRLLLNALPAMTRTRKLEVVERFFAAEASPVIAGEAKQSSAG